MVAKLKQKEIHFIAFSKNSLMFYFFQGKSVGHFSCRDITYSAIRFSYVVKKSMRFQLESFVALPPFLAVDFCCEAFSRAYSVLQT